MYYRRRERPRQPGNLGNIIAVVLIVVLLVLGYAYYSGRFTVTLPTVSVAVASASLVSPSHGGSVFTIVLRNSGTTAIMTGAISVTISSSPLSIIGAPVGGPTTVLPGGSVSYSGNSSSSCSIGTNYSVFITAASFSTVHSVTCVG